MHSKLIQFKVKRESTPSERLEHYKNCAAGLTLPGMPLRKYRYPKPFDFIPYIWNVTLIVLALLCFCPASMMAEKPMLCQAHTRSTAYSLPQSIPCTYINPADKDRMELIYATIYKDNLEQYETKAHGCRKTRTTTHSWVGFTRLRRERKVWNEPLI
jgi:hypothetical protein